MLAHPVERARAASCVVLRSLLHSSYSSLQPISSHLYSRFVLFLILLASSIFHHLFHFYIPFFSCSSRRFLFFSFFFCFSPCSFFCLFLWIHCIFLVFAAHLFSLSSVEFLHVSLRTSCSSLFFLANFFDVETRYILVSSFSLFGLRVLPPLLFYLLLRRCYTWFTLSLESVRATKMRWPRRPKESRGADSGVSNEGSCRSRDIAANRTAKWNSN